MSCPKILLTACAGRVTINIPPASDDDLLYISMDNPSASRAALQILDTSVLHVQRGNSCNKRTFFYVVSATTTEY